MASLLETLAHLVSSRPHLTDDDNDDEDHQADSLVTIHATLEKATDLSHVLQHVLDESSYIAHRATPLDPLVEHALHLLLQQAQGVIHASITNPHSISLATGVMNSHLVLDRTASDAIHLLPTLGTKNSNCSYSSLYGILNQWCCTSMARRELKSWLRQPLVNLQEIQKRQDAISFLIENNNNNGMDRLREEALLGWPDVDALAVKLNGYGQPQQQHNIQGPTTKALACLYKLYLLAVQQVPVLRDCLDHVVVVSDNNNNNCTSVLLQDIRNGIRKVEMELSLSQQLVEALLDLEQAPRHYLVKSSFHPEMEEIKQELTTCQDELEVCVKDMNEEWTRVSGKEHQVRLESLDNGDYQFRLPNTNDAKLLQARFQHTVFVHRLLKNGVYFSTKELRQLATKQQDLIAEYDKHQRSIVADAMKVAATYVPVLERVSSLVSQLDVLCSLAHVAAYSPTGYCKPILTDGDEDGLGIEVRSWIVVRGIVRLANSDIFSHSLSAVQSQLKGARHPCVELQDSMEYIPNDISLIFGESNFLMVTGPNMGGKSTYIRALGAIVTLAQIGAYVPCTFAKINIVHHILARVGAGDVQNSGISTFMAEMLEASSILRTATKRSLIIIDELGRGTSTFDGYGLAKAISEYIVDDIGCMTVFATHFHELTSLEDRRAMVKNCHVTAATDPTNGLTFMYEVKPGPCLESFGIQVAELASMPASVVADAKRRAKTLENFGSHKRKKVVTGNDVETRFRQVPLGGMNAEEKKQAMLQFVKSL